MATRPGESGFIAEGRSVTEGLEITEELARSIVESCLNHSDPLPPAFNMDAIWQRTRFATSCAKPVSMFLNS